MAIRITSVILIAIFYEKPAPLYLDVPRLRWRVSDCFGQPVYYRRYGYLCAWPQDRWPVTPRCVGSLSIPQ